MIKYIAKPNSFTLQWHITERCNWRCRHCYQENKAKINEMPLSGLKIILSQYISLLAGFKIKNNRARINISGGEPLLRKDFFELAKLLYNNKDKFHWNIFTNGSYINKEVAKKLNSFEVHFCQISLEGAEKTNDYIRGRGSFKKIIKAIETLVAQNINVRISLTLSRKNIADVPELTCLLDDLGVSFFNTRRLVPNGRGSQFKKEILNRKEQFEYYDWVEKTNNNLRKNNQKLKIITGCDSGVYNGSKPAGSATLKNFCGVVNGTLLLIMPNGDVMPCRRLPIIIGNLLKNDIYELWSSPKLKEMRNTKKFHPLCRKCQNFEHCFGGAKCITYAYTDDYFAPDILCDN